MAVKKSKKPTETPVEDVTALADSDLVDLPVHDEDDIHSTSHQSDAEESSSDYSSDDSEDEAQINTIGSVPLKWYADSEHVGYDLLGRKIEKTLRSSEVDDLLRSTEDPNNWRTIRDVKNDREIMLTDTDIEIIRRLRGGLYPSAGLQEEFAEFEDKNTVHPEVYRDPSKARFLPCKWESKAVRRLVKMIRSGKL